MAQTPPQPPSARPFLAWVWAGLLIVGGAAFLGINTGLIPYAGPLIPLLALGLATLAVPFVARWLVRRAEWWAALTAWVFVALAGLLIVMALDLPYPQIVGMVVLVEIALPFGAVFASNRQRRWALIPFYALLALAALLGLTILNIPLETLGALALLAAALPFWAIYMQDRGQWWALIPAGAISVVGVLLLAAFTFLKPGTGGFYVLVNTTLAVVCLALWLTVRRLGWALWLAIGFGLAAVLSIWFPSLANWALVALAMGVYISYRQIEAAQRRRAAAAPPAQAQPSQPPPPSPAIPRPSAPPPATPPPGQQADREATTAHEVRKAEGGEAGSTPVVEFRPLDPFKARREQQEKEKQESEGENGEQSASQQ